VTSLQGQRTLQQLDQLIETALILIVAYHTLEFIGVHDNVEAARLCQAELLAVNAGEADLLPSLRAVGFARNLDGLLVVPHVGQGARQRRKVGHVIEQDSGGLEHLHLVASVSDLLDLGVVRSTDELFHFT